MPVTGIQRGPSTGSSSPAERRVCPRFWHFRRRSNPMKHLSILAPRAIRFIRLIAGTGIPPSIRVP